ncbi:CMRF35-like molecule 8 isoform X2 [Gouania willdenowi]|uniref:CMRF35-like molecule 8 n=1 Tax=Gouania willdenowi TaxID=441366 RepID=A0A8C5DEW0_GOUWI|nr:CMRF35-like molecule 8 isoform X2 [Gouania willdenowi]
MALTLVLILFLQGLCESEALSVKGKVKDKINITCSHTNAWSNMKYFCKEKCENKDVLIKSNGKNKNSDGRYSIEDKGNVFFVIISKLTIEDSGTYWCAIDRVGVDTYNKVSITVEEDKTGNEESLTTNTKASFSKMMIYIGAGLGMVVLVSVIVLVIFVKHQRRIIHSSSAGKNPETIYTTLFFEKEDSLAIEHHETNCRTKNSAENTDANVSPQPQNQRDDLFYTTVSFVKRPDFQSTIAPHSATE